MKKPVIGITGNEKTHPDDDIMMSYAAKGFVEGVKDAGGIPIILPIGINILPTCQDELVNHTDIVAGHFLITNR